ncbi:unnamed protein product [Cladocopium goreaui]|uniref:Uncharacterized protein n=1 Tax=Cladocopium goreaui TaxID=2562237 RepID=A0A9P1CH71_9DINO|nr:unnamed protein product [Cladocopium goreaui]
MDPTTTEGSTSVEPRAAGRFCPGFALASVGDVNQPDLLRSKTLRLDDTHPSTDSLQVHLGESGASLKTPSPKHVARSLSAEWMHDRLPDTPFTPLIPDPVFTIDFNPGWTYVLDSWCKNHDDFDNHWLSGPKDEIFIFNGCGTVSPDPTPESFPLRVIKGKPPMAENTQVPVVASTEPEQTQVSSETNGTEAGEPTPSHTEGTPGSGSGLSNKATGGAGTRVAPTKELTMYEDGTYWKMLVSNYILLCWPAFIHPIPEADISKSMIFSNVGKTTIKRTTHLGIVYTTIMLILGEMYPVKLDYKT